MRDESRVTPVPPPGFERPFRVKSEFKLQT